MRTANRVGAYQTKEAALTIVRQAIEKHGVSAADPLALVEYQENRRYQTIAAAESLALLASELVPAA